MAFPIPSHLPRRANPQDVSSSILTKIDTATNKSLNAELATSWLTELDETINATKERIYDRIHENLPEFERQLVLSKSVQERFQTLTEGIDALDEAVSNPNTGIIPTLIGALTTHAQLAQQSCEADVSFRALAHLERCKQELTSLTSIAHTGKLPEAVAACSPLEGLLDNAPSPLNKSKILAEIKRQYRATRDFIQEQLSDAYTRCIMVNPTEFTILPSVQVRQSEKELSLSSILAALSTESLSGHLTRLRRDITSHFIDHILKQPTSVTVSKPHITPIHTLSHFPAPPNDEPSLIVRLENLSTILNFLSENLFPSLPPHEQQTFPPSLCRSLSNGILNHLLTHALPSSFDGLASFKQLVQASVKFEAEYIVSLLGNDAHDTPIASWAGGAGGHYERKRRLEILDAARVLVIGKNETAWEEESFSAEIDAPVEVAAIPVQEEYSAKSNGNGNGNVSQDEKWKNFDDQGLVDEEDSWGLDDDIPEPEPEPESAANVSPEPEPVDSEPDPDDAWGWNDDASLPVDEEEPDSIPENNVWDDPWGEDNDPVPEPSPTIAPAVKSPPKAATRLEKLAAKANKQANSATNSAVNSPTIAVYAPPPSPPKTNITTTLAPKRPLGVMTVPKEHYRVTARLKRIITIVENVLREGSEFASASVFSGSSSSSAPGTVLLQSAPSVLDLYRALYPVREDDNLAGMCFSNDCLWMSKEVERVARQTGSPAVKRRLEECGTRLHVLSESWYYDTVEKQCQAIDDMLTKGAQGFSFTIDQNRYDECEEAVNDVLKSIRQLAQRWKGVLAKSRYYSAIGLVVEAALGRMLDDILTLSDIPEVESHRLSEMCKIFNALEGIFVEDPDKPPFPLSYVPSWLKFLYLSDLLEASMADITELFEEGSLVDFDVEELAKLVRALFADTPLRATTIAKFMGGHPGTTTTAS